MESLKGRIIQRVCTIFAVTSDFISFSSEFLTHYIHVKKKNFLFIYIKYQNNEFTVSSGTSDIYFTVDKVQGFRFVPCVYNLLYDSIIHLIPFFNMECNEVYSLF